MDEKSILLDAINSVITVLLALVGTLAALVWRKHEKSIADLKREHSERMDEMSAVCRQYAQDLTGHTSADTAAHEKIKGDLASAIDRLNSKIDDKTDALSVQITTQHGALSSQIFEVLKLIKGGK